MAAEYKAAAEDEAAARVATLRRELAAHDARYAAGRPTVADAEYDALSGELRRLEAQFPALRAAASPTRQIADRLPDGGFAPLPHGAPMLSLDNVFSAAELDAWLLRVAADAGSRSRAHVRAEDGRRRRVAGVRSRPARARRHPRRRRRRRGRDREPARRARRVAAARRRRQADSAGADGHGDDGPPRVVEVRGEVYLPDAEFARLNAELAGARRFANPRNAAAGSLRTRDSSVVAARGLHFAAWGTGRVEPRRFRRHSDELDWLAAAGFTVDTTRRRATNAADALAYVADSLARRHQLGFAVDGVVLKVDDLAARDELGATAKAPRWAVAFKFPAEERTTRMRRITVNTGRSGKVTPFAVLEPVFVGGATVSLANLSNEGEVARKDLREGDLVVVRRAGDVRPEVVAPVVEERPADSVPWQFPRVCPSCATALVRKEGEADWRCPNTAGCPSQSMEWLTHFAETLEIDGIGYATAHALLQSESLRDPGDLFFLERAQLLALPGVGPKTADKLLASIDRARTQPLWRVLVALNVRHVGPTTARLLARALPSLTQLQQATTEQLTALDGIGATVAGAVHDWFADAGHAALVDKLLRGGVQAPRRHRVGPARGQDDRAHGRAGLAVARSGASARRGRRRRGGGQRLQAHRLRRGRRGARRHQARPRPGARHRGHRRTRVSAAPRLR